MGINFTEFRLTNQIIMKKSLILSLLLANVSFGIPASSITWQSA